MNDNLSDTAIVLGCNGKDAYMECKDEEDVIIYVPLFKIDKPSK